MKEIQVGIIGFGTVGRGTAEVIYKQAERIAKRSGLKIVLKRVADIVSDTLPAHFGNVILAKDANDIFNDPDIDIVVELIGGTTIAKTFILQAIEKGKHVVTANKALLSIHGTEIFAAAAAKNVEVGFEASVGGGIPLIKALKEGLVANRIESIMGIMNGTGNYILTQMTDYGTPFAEVLKDAQEKGFAEADPTYDVEGIDTAHKLVILMTMAYGMHMRLEDVSCEGITAIQPIDIEFAKEFGYRIKLLAISRNHGDTVEARVHPTLVPEKHLLANINGAYNAIHFTGDMVEDVLLYGKGAGMMPTGSAVVADIVDIARNIDRQAINRVPSLSYLPDQFTSRGITPMESIRCPYYFRFSTVDKPGVLSKIAGVLGNNGISIESVIQKARKQKGSVPIVMRTYEACEADVTKALAEIENMDITIADTVKIRILVDEEE
ncbi:MAG: homoserine dehydrogenase [Desulfobulbaceae bacterium]|uniref:Homoserine dehydrogenase n=1 Tax=Candidatus Desulfobia pelagia TaxID=2841692 RepID=A0A8J6TH06_9BACT|nr:homoserine dehydrogenase [Candidatus Desulfobia pelagia]